MTSKSLRHITHYIVLLFILLGGLLAMVLSGKNNNIHIFILCLISASYFVWGMAHHLVEKDLRPEIVFEYLIFSVLGTALVLGVLFYL